MKMLEKIVNIAIISLHLEIGRLTLASSLHTDRNYQNTDNRIVGGYRSHR